jgi:hypothetical protein
MSGNGSAEILSDSQFPGTRQYIPCSAEEHTGTIEKQAGCGRVMQNSALYR